MTYKLSTQGNEACFSVDLALFFLICEKDKKNILNFIQFLPSYSEKPLAILKRNFDGLLGPPEKTEAKEPRTELGVP